MMKRARSSSRCSERSPSCVACAAQRQRDIERHATPTVVHKLGELLDVAGPRIPDKFVERLVFGSAPDRAACVSSSTCPDDLQRAAAALRRSLKRRLHGHSGQGWANRVCGAVALSVR